MPVIARRLEERISLTVRVDLCSLDVRHRTLNERLNLWSLPGDFRARARVVYCEPLGDHSFAIGFQVLASSGDWE
jgi:hypothetical protein